jgi:hypothetical protein
VYHEKNQKQNLVLFIHPFFNFKGFFPVVGASDPTQGLVHAKQELYH